MKTLLLSLLLCTSAFADSYCTSYPKCKIKPYFSAYAWQQQPNTPDEVLNKFHRPMWFSELPYQPSEQLRHAAVGPVDSPTRAEYIKMGCEQTLHAKVVAIVDIESYWPGGEGYWYGGVPDVTDKMIDETRAKTKQAFTFIEQVRNACGKTKIGAYLPNNVYNVGQIDGPFKKLVIDEFVTPLSKLLDFLVVDTYAHPNDTTPALYQTRITWLLGQYANLRKPLRPVMWPGSVKRVAFDLKAQDKYYDAYFNALACKVDGVVYWDDLRTWTSAAQCDVKRLESIK